MGASSVQRTHNSSLKGKKRDPVPRRSTDYRHRGKFTSSSSGLTLAIWFFSLLLLDLPILSGLFHRIFGLAGANSPSLEFSAPCNQILFSIKKQERDKKSLYLEVLN